MRVMPDLNEKLGGASLNNHHWYPVEKSVCTRRFDISMGSLTGVNNLKIKKTNYMMFSFFLRVSSTVTDFHCANKSNIL